MKHIEYLFIIILVLTLTLWSWERNKVWSTEISIMTDATVKSPHKERPWSNLSAAYIMVGDWTRGRDLAFKAMEIDDKQYYLYYNLSVAYENLGDLEASYRFARRAALMNKDKTTLTQLGIVLKKMGYTTDGKVMIKGGV
jgi:hypothetical protein